jgi:hypothetical protein
MAAHAGTKAAYHSAVDAAKTESASLASPFTGHPSGFVVVEE